MNTVEQRRKAIGLKGSTLAREAKVAASSVSRLESGGDMLISTKRKIFDTLKRLEAEHAEIGYVSVAKTTIQQGRRRPDIARARKTLGITQAVLAEEWKTTVHEISKIESGYDTPDTVLEEMIDGQLRAMMKERGFPWPGDEPLVIRHKNGKEIRVNPEPIGWTPPTEEENKKILSLLGSLKCTRCDRGILWGPDGKPHVCPICNGKG